ncbi:MAG TPA: hypothetical protein PK514_06005 [Spirochaetota bacterium]|nr:hypothetical protein [Spirochaetota bacterium]
MKLSEFKNTKKFLTILFNFFKENGIISSIEPVENYDRLLERILECELSNISYYPGMYCADFKLREKIEKGEVYYFIFGTGDESASLLIDLGERDLSSFFNFTWNIEKHPPYLKDFIDDNGGIKLESEVPGYDSEPLEEKDVISFDDFKEYLDKNREQGRLVIVEVE